jgi:hypothetical protein
MPERKNPEPITPEVLNQSQQNNGKCSFSDNPVIDPEGWEGKDDLGDGKWVYSNCQLLCPWEGCNGGMGCVGI